MIIESLEFKNIKSYGNKVQLLNFDNEGGLILLTGTNGAGKSTILDSIDLSLFNQVRGKQTTRIPLNTFPNRINKELFVGIKFYNTNDDYIEIERKMYPNSFSIKKNHEAFSDRFKQLSNEEREKVIGFDYNTFKSFISLSMNDFLNFIKLSSEDKRNLLNRLFKLDEIDEYSSINNELINQNNKEIERLVIEVTNIDKTLKEYKSLISETKKSQNKLSKQEIKDKMLSKKGDYLSKKGEIKDLDDKISDILVKVQENRNHITVSDKDNIRKRVELNNINEKIKLYEGGQCPHCSSDLNGSEHLKILEELRLSREELKKAILSNDGKIGHYKEENSDLYKQQTLLTEAKSDINNEFIKMRGELMVLKDRLDNYVEDGDDITNELKVKGTALVKEKTKKLERVSFLRGENKTLTTLKTILSDKGVRRDLVASLIPPINDSLTTILEEVNFPYMVKLDENFDAKIYDRGELIHSESPSNGEIRILNVCIAISYIEMVRKMNKINVLFMDEVFQSIHKDNINIILDILKRFSKKHKLNLILVHHGLEEVDSKIFDRIISVEKDLFFSDINDSYEKV